MASLPLRVTQTLNWVDTFTPSIKQGNNWVLSLVGAVQPVTPETPETLETPVTPEKQTITTSANGGANFLNTGYLLNYAETQTLLQRMGDVRQGKTDGNVSGFRMNYSGYQFGVDKRLSAELPVYLGLFMGSTTGSPHYQSGEGTTRSDHFGIYNTWIADSGFISTVY